MKPLLEVEELKKHYRIRQFLKPDQWVRAVDGVSFTLEPQKTLALVGESGCGKSTLAKVLMQIEPKTEGKILIQGQAMEAMAPSKVRQSLQMIFQDPYSSLNPRRQAFDIIAEPLKINTNKSAREIRKIVADLMEKVGLRADQMFRYPHMFSGGQRQRIGIARALVLKPKILICDEPVSALDVSVQAQVLNLLMDLQDEMALSYLFISHDLAVVRHLADEIMVMYLGKIVEGGSRQRIFENPQHPYTQTLMASTPRRQPVANGFKNESSTVQGEMPSPVKPPSGCAYHTRCPRATDRCRNETPVLRPVEGREVACHLVPASRW